MEDYEKLMDELKSCSPDELSEKLTEIELFDEQSSIEMLNEIHDQFDNEEKMGQQILVPIFTAVVDGLMERTSFGRKMRKRGLTSSRIIQDCESFSYPSVANNESGYDNGYSEYKNAREYTKEFAENKRAPYDRDKYDDDSKTYYKDSKVAEDGGAHVNLKDEYTGKRNITASKSSPDQRRNDPTSRYQAQADHVVPLKRVYEEFKGNYGLSDEDIARIGNSDDNLRLTAARINQGERGKGGKNDMTNTEFVADQRRRKAEGRPHLGLSEEELENMLQAEKDAHKSINKQANKTVGENILGKGTADQDKYKEAYEKEAARLGHPLTSDDYKRIDKELARDKQAEILGHTAENAVDQAKDYLVGNLVLYIVKPLYFEMKDIFKNGVAAGVDTDSTIDAFKIRFNRLKNYVVDNALAFFGNNVWEFVKGFVSSFVEGIISLFVGVFKRILKLIKEGIKVFTKAGKILFSKESSELSPAEKGDAIIKILGGSIAIIGIVV